MHNEYMSKILFIGLDAADWGLVSQKVLDGKLPHLSKVIAQGVSGPLRSIDPLFSPSLWATIATGKRAYEHGITGFTLPDHNGSGLRPYDRMSRRSPALWNMFTHTQKTSHVIGWWNTAPAEKILGVMVDETFRIAHCPCEEPWEIGPASVSPMSFASKLAQERVHPQQLSEKLLRFLVPKLYEINPSTDFRIAAIAKVLAEDLTTLQVTLRLMKEEPWDLTSLYLIGLDSLSHLAMCYREPILPGEKERDCELYGGVVDRAYELYDQWIGQLIEAAGKASTVVIASDHGFYHDVRKRPVLGIEETAPVLQHAPIGTLIMEGPSLCKGQSILHATILDLCPTLLTLAGLPVGRDMPGKVLEGAFVQKPIIKKIRSWDSSWEASLSHAAPTPESTERALRQLVSLGYLREMPESKQTAIFEGQCNDYLHRALCFLADDRIDQALPLLQKANVISKKRVHSFARTDILEELASLYFRLGAKRLAAACFYHVARDSRRNATKAHEQFWKKTESTSQKNLSFKDAWEIRDLIARSNLDEEKTAFITTLARFLAHEKNQDLESLFGYCAMHPEDFLAHVHVGRLALQCKRNEEGIAFLRHVASRQFENPAPLALLANYYNEHSNAMEAEKCAQEALCRDPLHRPSWLALAASYVHQGRWKEASKAAREAQKSLVERSDAFKLLAHISLEGKQDSRKAMFYLQRAEKAQLFLSQSVNPSLLPKKRANIIKKKFLRSQRARDSAKRNCEIQSASSLSSLTPIFQTDLLRRPRSKSDAALNSHCDVEGALHIEPSSQNAGSALTRMAKLVSPFEELLQRKKEREPANSGQSPLRSPGLPVVPHLPSQSPRYDQYEISGLNRPIIVTGLPRSGTSLIMQMLAAGGIMIDADEHRSPDKHNPQGYFEHEKVKTMTAHAAFLKAGFAIKVVIPLLFNLPRGNQYQIIWVRRALDEVITSQHRMGGYVATASELYHVYHEYEIQATAYIQSQDWPLLMLHYSSIIEDPELSAEAIAHFLDKKLPLTAMRDAVIPNLYRVREGGSLSR